MNQSKSTILIFIVIFLFSAFLYLPSLNYYFFQDDWFVLNWVRTDDFASFFKFRTDIIYWRPLSMPLFFKIGYILFNLNPFGYHSIVFIFHLLNIILVYLLFKTLKISKLSSLLASFLFATASFHFIPLSWLSTTSYVMGLTFIIATMILFLKNKFIWAFLFFCLSLASTELALPVIPILVILGGERIRSVKVFFPYIIIAIAYLVLRFLIFPLPRSGQYTIKLTPQILSSFFWYFIWIFNIPEKMSTIFLFSSLKNSILVSINFLKYLFLPIILIGSFFLTIFLSKLNIKKTFEGIGWFILGILPVIFLPSHVYPMYLTVASLGVFYIFALSLDKLKSKKKLLIFIFGLIWYISSSLTLSFTRNSHWVVNQQAISKAYTQYVKKLAPNPPKGTAFLFKEADKDFYTRYNFVLVETEENLSQSLNDQDAMKVIYQDQSIKSYYAAFKEKLVLPPDTHAIEVRPSIR